MCVFFCYLWSAFSDQELAPGDLFCPLIERLCARVAVGVVVYWARVPEKELIWEIVVLLTWTNKLPNSKHTDRGKK